MVQMMDVSLLALGIPDIFHSIEEGGVLHNEILVAGHVVMRVALVAQLLRATRRDPARRSILMTYVLGWSLAQVGWIALIVLPLELPWVFLAMLPLYVLELGVPWYAERQGGLPWHPHHIAERYGLLVIIALGEGVVGTIAALGALLDAQGWTTDTVLLLISGMAVTFAMWWVYFVLPHGELLDVRRGAAPLFTVLHYPLYMAIAAAATGIVALGAPVLLGILVASLAPAVTIAGYEWRGHRHLQGEVAQLQSSR